MKSIFILLWTVVASQAAVVMTVNYDTIDPISVTATVTLDDSVLGNSYSFGDPDTLPTYVTDFQVEVSGATSGNGIFSVSNGDYSGMVFETDGELPLVAGDFTLDNFFDLNFYAAPGSPDAPNGVFFFLLEIGDGTNVQATSLSAIPEPASIALLSFGGLAFLRRRSRRTGTDSL